MSFPFIEVDFFPRFKISNLSTHLMSPEEARQKFPNPGIVLHMFWPALGIGRDGIEAVIFFGHEFLS